MDKEKVAVLMGGDSNEREISLRSGAAILSALKRNQIDAIPFDPKFRSLTEMVNEKITKVFIALHGTFGEDGHVQGVLEYLGIPYTGSGLTSSAIAMEELIEMHLKRFKFGIVHHIVLQYRILRLTMRNEHTVSS